MLYRLVKINRDITFTLVKFVQAHEIAVLREVWDDVSVIRYPKFKLINRPYLSDEAEYKRLCKVYDRRAVEAAYGKLEDGRLGKAYRAPLWAYWLQKLLPAPKRHKPVASLDSTTRPQHRTAEEQAAFRAGMLKAVDEGLARAGSGKPLND